MGVGRKSSSSGAEAQVLVGANVGAKACLRRQAPTPGAVGSSEQRVHAAGTPPPGAGRLRSNRWPYSGCSGSMMATRETVRFETTALCDVRRSCRRHRAARPLAAPCRRHPDRRFELSPTPACRPHPRAPTIQSHRQSAVPAGTTTPPRTPVENPAPRSAGRLIEAHLELGNFTSA